MIEYLKKTCKFCYEILGIFEHILSDSEGPMKYIQTLFSTPQNQQLQIQ